MAFQPPIAIAHSPLLPTFLSDNDSPPIHTVLQAHSRLKNVQTLTTGLQPVVHSAFGLRFVPLEEGTFEDGASGKGKERWVDWIGERVGSVSEKSDWAEKEGGEDRVWLEAQRCLEATAGAEGAVAVLLIASTADPSPIAALQALHTLAKPFADAKALLIFYLVITTSPADPTLLPSLQRTFGPHCGVLSLPAPLQTENQIAVPPPLPAPPPLRSALPPTPALPQTTPTSAIPQSALTEDDDYINQHVLTPGELPDPLSAGIDGMLSPGGAELLQEKKEPKTISSSVSQAWHRFLREFVTQSLVPFMERSVLSLHESYTSRRALPNRLLSITSRRFFGSSSAPASTSTSPKPTLVTSSTSLVGTPAGDRRLVEWSAMLGDQKEVQAVGDPIRREARGANVEDVLLLHALHHPPPPPPAAHAVPSLTPLAAACLKPPISVTADSLLSRALVLSRADYMLNVRSENGISGMSVERRKEVARWFVLAAAGAEEPLAALLLARAGSWETGRRRKGMWYALAGALMEQFGIKRLAVLYLRRAYDLFSQRSDLKLGELGEIDPAFDQWLEPEKRNQDGFPMPEDIPRHLERLTGEKFLGPEPEPVKAATGDKPLLKRTATVYSESPMRAKEELTGAAVAGFWGREAPKEVDPLVVGVSVDEGFEVAHDFGSSSGSAGPAKLHVTFTLRNISPSKEAEFVLRLPSAMAAATAASAPLIPPQWTGALVYRGTVLPGQEARRTARLHISRSGQYALAGWRLLIVVGADRFVQVGKEGAVSVVQAQAQAQA
ncbi:hypothetical protein CALCODRAFT_479918 [Calocera cornea HHB12733]|uniref:Uncharacterized protein n=1 Tax=Calocera cornea HHB12733 TaxID=1353952 RepID=A0A165J614_9BASI|nr:hypothetical protein CALCODRAFT_479918 [Calocera cornea HHB12733]